MRFTTIYSDEQGETHFGFDDVPEKSLAIGPPPNPPGQMCDLGSVSNMRIIAFPAGTLAPAHNAPEPYFCVILSGEAEVIASDGQVRRFQAGDLLVCNDLTGKGHVTRAITSLTLSFVTRTNPNLTRIIE